MDDDGEREIEGHGISERKGKLFSNIPNRNYWTMNCPQQRILRRLKWRGAVITSME